MSLLTPTSPETGRPLRPDTPHSLADGAGGRWPVAAGIPYLRPGKDDLRAEALAALDAGDEPAALSLLLRDQDPFAPVGPPAREVTRELVAAAGRGGVTLRDAMRALNFGPVADYFALRPSTPTFLSGLGLLSQYGGDLPVVEVACGIGQLIREPCRRGEAVAGIDLVFSKLWLARQFIVPRAELLCGDACGGAVAEPTGALTVLCHDAFYFFGNKPGAARALMRLAGAGGRVLVGHAHNAGWDHGGVAGNLLTPEGYADLFPGCRAFDDADFTTAFLSGRPAEAEHPAALVGVEAVSLAWHEWGDLPAGPPDRYADPLEGEPLTLNPLLEAAGGALRPRWPSAKFAAEYRSADYLGGEPVPSDRVLEAAGRGLWDEFRLDGTVPAEVLDEVRRLARKRVLIPTEDVI